MLHNYLSRRTAEQELAEPGTLAVLAFAPAVESSTFNHSSIPCIQVANVTDTESLEVWKEDGAKVEHGESNGCHWRRSKNLQFASVTKKIASSDDYQKVAYAAYQQLLDFIAQSPLSEFVRFWNYIPQINLGEGDRENYRRFCNGRLQAFQDHSIDASQFPAASAVGHFTDSITLAALTSNQVAEHHTNPRQVDAFKYPRQYGPSSPSFARATTVGIDQHKLCFISGTASILGHQSVHQGDLLLQLYTTNDNILYLLEQTNFGKESVRTLRVYLRNPDDHSKCHDVITSLFPATEIIYAHADICRADLLIEIECYCVAE